MPALPPAASATYKVSDSVNLNIYLDVTGSMRGFLEPGKATGKNYFSDFLNLCESSLRHGVWSNTSLQVFTFGKTDKERHFGPQAARSLLDFRDKPAQFNGSKTLIEQAVEHQPANQEKSPNPEVKIIVTDLFEDEDKLAAAPADAISARYLKQATPAQDPGAVGIFAVRNSFSGTVEDMPGAAHLHNAAESMPFYILVLGNVEDVRACMQRLKRDTAIGQAVSSGDGWELVLSRQVARTSPGGLPIADIQKGHGGWKQSQHGPNHEDISYVSLHGDTAVTVDTSKLAAPPEDMQKVVKRDPKVKISAFSCNGSSTQSDADAASSVEVNLESNPASVKINTTQLRKGRNYLFRFDVVSEEEGSLRADTEFLKPWQIDRQSAKAVSASGSFEQKRGRTTDLAAFLTSLSNQMFFGEHPTVATYYLYVEAR